MGVGDFTDMDYHFDSFRVCILTDGFWGIVKEIKNDSYRTMGERKERICTKIR